MQNTFRSDVAYASRNTSHIHVAMHLFAFMWRFVRYIPTVAAAIVVIRFCPQGARFVVLIAHVCRPRANFRFAFAIAVVVVVVVEMLHLVIDVFPWVCILSNSNSLSKLNRIVLVLVDVAWFLIVASVGWLAEKAKALPFFCFYFPVCDGELCHVEQIV